MLHDVRYHSVLMKENRMVTWQERWRQRRTSWHLPDLHFDLENHASKLLPKPERRILVPLCGKSVDVEWLYREGHTVVGIEGIEQPIVEFFSERNLPYTTDHLTWAKVFKTEDDRLRMYCCDIFKMDMESLGKFDAVWDRASLVAIYEEDREKYAKVIKALLAPDFRYLISTTQYTPLEVYSGPPRNIPTALVEKLFSDVCELQVLEETTRPKEVIEQWGFDYYVETALLLTPRS
ncbi:thiopurine S-methyltransferase-like isoform X2 [Portunus trituberculatus]|uniref:thiopurine S-methyltransferase-like isoform X2 n=1 Tax=Portunus trituberculatus TaxID=210409 RepID=UPI001E1CE448|nr:thiopurine S-methyltransferase-like isoform X2 [Portunus trituberculatus]XP_045110633.1 thiopurine S-methyltransferase-like isoform X2 [Portunus trituberculatus]